MATTIDDNLLRKLLPPREIGAHKWGVGGVLIIAGSPQYPGAAWLASRAAGRSGAGIVYLATPHSVIATMASAMPEVAFVPLPETDVTTGASRTIDLIRPILSKVKAVLIGPGLGQDETAANLLTSLFGFGQSHRHAAGIGFGSENSTPGHDTSIFSLTDAPIVVDADALNWLANKDRWWKHVPANRLILTPHPGEAHRLSGIEMPDIVADPPEIARKLARRWKQTTVIKSGYTAAASASRVVISDLAPTSLATAGSGDCLAGSISAFLAQGCSPLDAATLAIGIGTRAAVRLEQIFGSRGMLASDLPDMMAQTLRVLGTEVDG